MGSSSASQGPICTTGVPAYAPTPFHPEFRDLIQAVQAVNSSMATGLLGEHYQVKFKMDTLARRPVIEVVEKDSKRVLFQVPPENVLAFARELRRGDAIAEAAHYTPSSRSPDESTDSQ
jgi:hypothetical protein